ncbi:hypothetical protein HKD37_04G009930 [Glycine soja]
MLLALRPSKFADNLCKKTSVAWTSCMKKPRTTFRWKKCPDLGQKHDKREENTKNDSHKSNKRHKPDKRQPFPKGPDMSITHP